MRFSTTAISLLSLAGSAVSVLTVDRYPDAAADRYLVKVKDDVSKDKLIARIANDGGDVTQKWDFINGFAGKFPTNVLKIILNSPDVEAVTEDGVATISGIQYDAPWGLSRISYRPPLRKESDPNSLTFPYFFPDNLLGEGVDIYVVDTGVRISHQCFGGRAIWGATFGGYPNADGNGHGTHVAGTAAGGQYGVAKRATIIAVKALSDQGSGAYSDIIDALNWVRNRARSTRNPSVVNMSLGGPANLMLDLAVRQLTSSGIHVAVAAGNGNVAADGTSPARECTACTVGASDINDARASFSNYGPSIKVFAPGVATISAWKDSDTAVKTISGTSMATPHVAGLIAYFIRALGNLPPADMIKEIQAYSAKNALSNIPVFTVNYLAQNRKY